jgi:hypothetical protein
VPAEALRGFAFTPDGRELAVATETEPAVRALQFHDVMTGRVRRTVRVPPCEWWTLLFSPDGKTMVVGDRERSGPGLVLVELATGHTRGEVPFKDVVTVWTWPPTLAFAPDGSGLLIADGSAGVVVVDPYTGRRLHRQEGPRGNVGSLVFSPSGQFLATPSNDATALVWRTADFLRPARQRPRTLSDAELAALWADLADNDAAKAARAIRALSLAPGEALPFLGKRLQPVPVLGGKERERLDRLLADLDNDSFEVRRRAEKEIAELGEAALPALEKVMAGRPGPEVRRAVERLAAALDSSESPECLRALRAVEALEQMGTPGAARLLRTLGGGAPGARLTSDAKGAQERLARRGGKP